MASPAPVSQKTPVPLSISQGTAVKGPISSTKDPLSLKHRVDELAPRVNTPLTTSAPPMKKGWRQLGQAIASFLTALFRRLFCLPTDKPPSPLNPPKQATKELSPTTIVPTQSGEPSPSPAPVSVPSKTLATPEIVAEAAKMKSYLKQLKGSIEKLALTAGNLDIPLFFGYMADVKENEQKLHSLIDKLKGDPKEKVLEGVSKACGDCKEAIQKIVDAHENRLTKYLCAARKRIQGASDLNIEEIEIFNIQSETLQEYGVKEPVTPSSEVTPPKAATSYKPSAPSLSESYEAPASSGLGLFSSLFASAPALPSGIPNQGNACYRSSSNQALRILTPVMEKIRQPIEIPQAPIKAAGESDKAFENRQSIFKRAKDDYPKREEIRKALLNLIDCVEKKRDAKVIEEADLRLATAVFKTGLNTDLKGLDNIFRQQDAAAYVGLILSDVLDINMNVQFIRTAVDESQTFSRSPPAQPLTTLFVPLDQREPRVQNLVDKMFAPVQYNTKINPLLIETGATKKYYEQYTEKTQLVGDPPKIVPISFVRAEWDGGESEVNRQLLQIPEDNIIDLSQGFGKPKNSLKYELKSFVVHAWGTTKTGHYISFAKVGDQWYKFNDRTVTTVTKDEFERWKALAYTAFFERVSEKQG